MSKLSSRIALGSAAVGLVLLYTPVAIRLWADWMHDDNYSHGFLIVPLALYFAWERRRAIAATPVESSVWGLPIVMFGLAMLLGGLLGAELFLTRVSFVVVLTGSVLFLLGPRMTWRLAFPLGFLLLMIPIPSIIFNRIAFPLQLVASQAGELGMEAFGVPVLREGNVIVLAHTTLEVAEACSGIRSLISLLTLGIVYGYFTDPRLGMRVAIAMATVPIAIVANGARVAGTGISAHFISPEAAEGFFHSFSGWLVFVTAFAMLFAVTWALRWLRPQPLPLQPMETTA